MKPALNNSTFPTDISGFDQLNSPFVEGKSRFYMNLACREPEKEGGATTLGSLPVDDRTLEMAGLLGTKAFLASDGYCLIGGRHQAMIEDYATYLETMKLLPENSVDRVLFVQDECSLNSSLQELAAQGDSGVTFYIETMQARALAKQAGLPQDEFDSALDMSAELNDFYSDKSRMRDSVEPLFPGGALPYPRLKIDRAGDLDLRQQIETLKTCADYYGQGTEGSVIFAQAVEGAGGRGNRVIYRDESGLFRFQDFTGTAHQSLSAEELFVALHSSGVKLELTPFLKVLDSRSYSIAVDEAGEISMLTRSQLLDPVTRDYTGFSVDRKTSRLDRALIGLESSIALRFSEPLAAAGYRGYFDVDTFTYQDRDGSLKSSVAEANMRRDSSSFLLSLVLKHELSREAFSKGEISLLLDDHLKCSADFVGEGDTQSKALTFVQKLERAGVPVFSAENQKGVALMSPLIESGNGYEFSLGIVAETDSEKNRIYQACKEILSA